MDDLPRQKLRELVRMYGTSLCDDSRRCEGLLRDLCPNNRREVNILVNALKERVAESLLSSSAAVPMELTISRLANRLHDNQGLTEDNARWAVDSWALALGKIDAAQVLKNKTPERGQSAKPKRASKQQNELRAHRPIQPSLPVIWDDDLTPAPRRKSRRFIIVTVILLLIGAVAGWFGWSGGFTNLSKRLNQLAANQEAQTSHAAPAPAVVQSAAPTVRPKPVLEISSTPSGATVLKDGVAIGSTPLRRDDLPAADTKFILLNEGYLPYELTFTIDPDKGFQAAIPLASPAPLYTGGIRVQSDPSAAERSIAITFDTRSRSGAMSQGTRHGEILVNFNGSWNVPEFRAVTGSVIARPPNVQWTPESFTLQFSPDGKTARYECSAGGKIYSAQLTGQSGLQTSLRQTYLGRVTSTDTPLMIHFSLDRRSGTIIETSRSGDTIVTFAGIWDGDVLRAVTGDVVSKPEKVQWRPESFTLHPTADASQISYSCNDSGRFLTAELSPAP